MDRIVTAVIVRKRGSNLLSSTKSGIYPEYPQGLQVALSIMASW